MSRLVISLGFSLCVASPVATYAQSSSANAGTVRGSVLDPSGAAIMGATVEIQNPVSHYDKSVQTDAQGNFEFDNVPYNNYHLSASAKGFQGGEQDINVRSPVPVEAKISLTIGTASQSVTVTAGADLVETDTTTHTDVDRELFDKLPLESHSSSLSSLVTLATPGVSADSNGLFHGLGDHASNSFSIDGQPITDQQSKVFSNQLPVDAVQSMEVIEGAPPAEYGGKDQPGDRGDHPLGLGSYHASRRCHGFLRHFWHYQRGLRSFLRAAEVGKLHLRQWPGHGPLPRWPGVPGFPRSRQRGERIRPGRFQTFRHRTHINLNLQFTRSWFQTPNSYDAQNATAWNGLVVNNGGLGPNGLPVGSADQRSKIRTFNIAPVWTRLLNPNTVFTFGGLRAAGSIQLLSER